MMIKELFTVAQKIKDLRGQTKMTQAELGKKLGLTRAAVNAWEMGVSAILLPIRDPNLINIDPLIFLMTRWIQ